MSYLKITFWLWDLFGVYAKVILRDAHGHVLSCLHPIPEVMGVCRCTCEMRICASYGLMTYLRVNPLPDR